MPPAGWSLRATQARARGRDRTRPFSAPAGAVSTGPSPPRAHNGVSPPGPRGSALSVDLGPGDGFIPRGWVQSQAMGSFPGDGFIPGGHRPATGSSPVGAQDAAGQ